MLADRHGNFARYEFERKYVLKKRPSRLPEKFVDIEDLYLSESSLRLRIEKSPDGKIIGRMFTKKDPAPDNHLASIMTSLYLSERDLIAIGEIKGNSLQKRRFIHQDENNRITYDFFLRKI